MAHNTIAEFYTKREIERQQQRARTYLLQSALAQLHPHARLELAYRLGSGYYFHIDNMGTILPAEVKRIEAEMRKIAADQPELHPVALDRAAAMAELERSGRLRTRDWLADQGQQMPDLYRDLRGGLLAFKGPVSSQLQDLGAYDLIPYPPGLLLRVKNGHGDDSPYKERPTLFRAFYEAEHWGVVQGVSFVSEVNARVRHNCTGELVRVSEALHARKIAAIADRIVGTYPRPKAVLISGPSSSGKTSFSHRLQVELRLLGLRPLTLSLDDFYKAREQVPKRENGEYDFEVIEALDIERINEVLLRLFAGEELRPPKLDFKTHQHMQGDPIRLAEDGIIIVEGIHGLNPRLTPHLTEPSVFRVYVSALTHLNLDVLSRVSTTDLRLLRRMVRDRRARGYGAEETLSRWPMVREGEQAHIFPFQERADVMFNSALPFELSALKAVALDALASVTREDLVAEAERLKRLLDAVAPMDPDWLHRHLPPTSIMREFIGGSVLVP